ncbi:MAG TPA: AsnC family transcriptional regulator [Trebonia sp.]|nr:AsnC family transcriptional regulator [Trebonia sp.]
METDSPDEVDRQLFHAVVIAPRAPFRLLADVIGVSDQTIARRYRKLVSAFGLRVTGVLNGVPLGWTDWYVRLQVMPGSADSIARALAGRPDTRWITLASGGTEIACVLQARAPEERDDLFLRGLPGSRRVTQITAQSILCVYSPVEWAAITSTLSADQVAVLRASDAYPGNVPRDPPPTEDLAIEPVSLRPEDHLLLAELARDGRASHASLAAALHWHESTVRRRIEELQQRRALYFDVDVHEDFLGVGLAAMLWLAVDPAHLDATGRAIARHPEVPFAAATTGNTNLVVSAQFQGTRHMYQYLTTRLTGLSGIRSVETSPVIGRFKQAGPATPRLSG